MAHPGSNRAPELYDYAGAAEYLDTSVRHVQRLFAERRLTGVKLGPRKVRFRRADLDTFLAQGVVDAVR